MRIRSDGVQAYFWISEMSGSTNDYIDWINSKINMPMVLDQ
jgi:hypothetical protein